MFFLSMGVPGGIFTVFGYTLGAFGALHGMGLWSFAALVALVQGRLWTMLAETFPERSGGIAMFAAEGWNRVAPIVAPIAAIGYWMAWSTANAVLASIAAQFLVRQWFSDFHVEVSFGIFSLGLAQLLAITMLTFFSLLNLRGVQTATALAKLSGVSLLVPIGLCLLAPFLSVDWSSARMQSGMPNNLSAGSLLQLSLAWLFTINFTVYASEITSVFTPEYRSQMDLRRASFTVTLFSLFVFTVVPFGIGGLAVPSYFAVDPAGAFVDLFARMLPIPYVSDLIVGILVSNLLIAVHAGIADAGRALQSSSIAGMMPVQWGALNSRGMPQQAIFFSLALNVFLIVIAASPVALIAAANVGYMVAIVLGLSAYLLIKPHRSGRRNAGWSVVAAILIVLNAVELVVGMVSFSLTGYGGWREVAIGVTVLLSALPLFAYRRLIQNRRFPDSR